MFGKTSKIIALVLSLVMILSICGVSATWYFATDTATVKSASGESDVGLAEFYFYDNENSVIDAIISEMNDANSDISSNLRSRFGGNWLNLGKHSYYGSMDPNQDGTGVAEMLEEYGSSISFVVVADINDYDEQAYTYTSAYIYTCDVYLGDSGSSRGILGIYYNTDAGNPTVPIGEYIYRVYRTEITRTGTTAETMSDWERGETKLGYAKSCWYCENRSLTPTATEIPSYDVTTWTQGNRGYSIDTAVYTFDGDTPAAYNDELDDNADLEIKYYSANYSSLGGGEFYYLLETAGNTYYYTYNQGYTYYGTTNSGNSSSTYEYNVVTSHRSGSSYSYYSNYTISTEDTSVEITILDSSGNEINGSDITGGANGSNSVTFTARGQGTKYYIKVDSGGTTAQLSVTRID